MPLVSIIVPCYNEQATIRLLLDAICQQTVCKQPVACKEAVVSLEARSEPHANLPAGTEWDLEVIIADGMSTDRTREEIAAYQSEHPGLAVHLVDNPRRIIPAALNCALAAARGTYIIRLDGHSVPAPDYVERCIADLEAGLGDNVGGVWEIRPFGQGLVRQAIAIAAAHPFGVGDARYRYTNQPGLVDTVPFGAFRRDVFDRFGCFDESLKINEDYEFNARLRQGGGRVWLDPRIRSTYYARSSLRALARQYWQYGYWKWRMLRRYPKTLRWRQALPPAFLVSLALLLALALLWRPARLLLAAEIALYGLVLVLGALPAARAKRSPLLALAVPLAIITMHGCWGAGFLWSMVTTPKK